MHASITPFPGDPDELQARYEALLAEVPTENMELHLLPQGARRSPHHRHLPERAGIRGVPPGNRLPSPPCETRPPDTGQHRGLSREGGIRPRRRRRHLSRVNRDRSSLRAGAVFAERPLTPRARR
jgi:hypothetical protein